MFHYTNIWNTSLFSVSKCMQNYSLDTSNSDSEEIGNTTRFNTLNNRKTICNNKRIEEASQILCSKLNVTNCFCYDIRSQRPSLQWWNILVSMMQDIINASKSGEQIMLVCNCNCPYFLPSQKTPCYFLWFVYFHLLFPVTKVLQKCLLYKRKVTIFTEGLKLVLRRVGYSEWHRW